MRRLGLLVFLIAGILIPPALTQQLQISSPVADTMVTSGTTLTITVSADPSVRIIGVLTDGHFPDLRPGSSPNEFLQVVPTKITPGIYHLTAIGVTSTRDVESDPVAIDVEPRDYPILVMNSSPVMNFHIGDQQTLQVTGTFADDSTLDVTRSTRTRYTSNNPKIVTVNSSGMVTAVGPGESSIVIWPGDSKGSPSAVLVYVAQPPPSGTPPVISDVTPLSGIPGATQVTINGSGFGTTRGNGILLLGTRNAAEIEAWSDNQIVAKVPAGSRNGFVEVGQGGLYSNDVPFTMNVPQIESISPVDAVVGQPVTITGSGFGATQGPRGTVTLNNKPAASIVSWTDDRIVAIVAPGTRPGYASVTQNGFTSDKAYFDIVERP